MRLSFGQQMAMQQKQVLAPRMIQSMEILQLPIMALQERIEQEIQENPCLEVSEDEDSELPEEPRDEVENPDAPSEEERELVLDESKDNVDDFERLLKMDEQWPDYFEDRSRPSASRMDEESERRHDAIANLAERPPSMQDYLRDQLAWFDVSDEVRRMAERIIYSLDSNGYLPAPLEDLLDANSTPEQLQVAREALELVQKLDPPGIGARNERECLLLQLQPGMGYYDELRILLESHLDDLIHNRWPLIERKTGFSPDLIRTAIGELQKLKLRPGAVFVDKTVPNVVPDVFLDVLDDGSYKVRLEEGHTPTLFISSFYRKLVLQGKATEEAKEYIKRKINSAQWLIESIEQRRGTLTRVAQAIVDHQRKFLEEGPEAIEPLKMQQIADRVGVHVTTVSRAVDDKWIQTPRGIFPLKRFFVGGTVSADGEEVAWDTVRLKLQEIIDQEDKERPYSDDELVNQLSKHGLKVARRTVTKYRKAMNIPSSRQRRDWTLSSGKKKNATSADEASPASEK